MQRLLVGVLVIAAFASPVAAQQKPPPPPPFAIQGWIDGPFNVTPFGFEPVLFTDTFHIDGWTFDCRTGDQVPFLAVSDADLTTWQTTWITDYRVIRSQPRPDVQAFFQPMCQTAGPNTGYSIYFPGKLTPGRHFLHVNWTTGDGYTQSRMVYIIVP